MIINEGLTTFEDGLDTLSTLKLSMMIVENNKMVLSSDERGIKPLYTAYTSGKCYENALLIDKVIGLGAAAIAVEIGITEVWTHTISASAQKFLESRHVDVQFKKSAEFILNRQGTGVCPVETIALTLNILENTSENSLKFEHMIAEIRSFLIGIGSL